MMKKIGDLLVETGKIGCRPMSTLIDCNHKLCKADEELAVDKNMYQILG